MTAFMATTKVDIYDDQTTEDAMGMSEDLGNLVYEDVPASITEQSANIRSPSSGVTIQVGSVLGIIPHGKFVKTGYKLWDKISDVVYVVDRDTDYRTPAGTMPRRLTLRRLDVT